MNATIKLPELTQEAKEMVEYLNKNYLNAYAFDNEVMVQYNPHDYHHVDAIAVAFKLILDDAIVTQELADVVDVWVGHEQYPMSIHQKDFFTKFLVKILVD